jgi:hypothetical protein
VGGILLVLVIGSVINGVALWIAIRIVAPSCERNTLLITFSFGAVLAVALLVPLYGLLLAVIVFYTVLVKVYDLSIGQSVMVLFFVVLAHIGLRALLARLIAP